MYQTLLVSSTPPPLMGMFSGSVQTPGGAPIAGVSISWSGPSSGSTLSNFSGAYFSPSLAPGSYTVSVSFPSGYTPVPPTSYSITVTGGSTTSVSNFIGSPSGGGSGFSGFMTLDGNPLPNVLVKVVDIYHPNWTWGGSINDILNGPGQSPGYEAFSYIATTDINGFWSVSGLNPASEYMLKIFPTGANKHCIANAVVPTPAYNTAETGYIDTSGSNFMSPPGSPAPNTYQTYYDDRYLFDLPVHIYPTVGGALSGAITYTDLSVNFFTRPSTFYNSNGAVTWC